MYVSSPVRFVCQFHSQVLYAGHLLQLFSMLGVGAGDQDVFLCDGEDVELAGIDGHLPVLFPFFKLLQVFLEDASVSLQKDPLVEDGVIGKQSHHGLGVLVQVVDIDDKQCRAKHRALRDTRGDLAYSQSLLLNSNLLGSVCQEALDPVQGLTM